MKTDRKILVCGFYNRFPSITDSVTDAFKRLDFTIVKHQFNTPLGQFYFKDRPFTFFPRLPFSQGRENKYLFKLIKGFKPNIVFILRGDLVDKDNLERLKSVMGFKIWVWHYDPISLTPEISSLFLIADKIFHYSYFETQKIKKLYPHKEVHFLPGAFDDRYHRSTSNKLYKHDLFFCAALLGQRYENRRIILNSVSKINETLGKKYRLTFCVRPTNFNIVKFIKIYLYIKNNYPYLFKNWVPQNYSRLSLVKKYNQSKTCLNLHSSFSEGVGLSWRTFELIGCGAIILCDNHPDLPFVFDSQKMPLIIINDHNDIIENLNMLFTDQHTMSSYKHRVHSIYNDHTYVNRMKSVAERYD